MTRRYERLDELLTSARGDHIYQDYRSEKYSVTQLCSKHDITPYLLRKVISYHESEDNRPAPSKTTGKRLSKTSKARIKSIRGWLTQKKSIEEIGKILEMSPSKVTAFIDRHHIRPKGEKSTGRALTVQSKNAASVALSEPDTPLVDLSEDTLKKLRTLWDRKKAMVKANGREFTARFKDLKFHRFCPVLTNLELDYSAVRESGKGRRRQSQPLFDLKDPKKGWTRDNVQMVSWRGMRIKKTGSAEDHLRVAEYLNRGLVVASERAAEGTVLPPSVVPEGMSMIMVPRGARVAISLD